MFCLNWAFAFLESFTARETVLTSALVLAKECCILHNSFISKKCFGSENWKEKNNAAFKQSSFPTLNWLQNDSTLLTNGKPSPERQYTLDQWQSISRMTVHSWPMANHLGQKTLRAFNNYQKATVAGFGHYCHNWCQWTALPSLLGISTYC